MEKGDKKTLKEIYGKEEWGKLKTGEPLTLGKKFKELYELINKLDVVKKSDNHREYTKK